MTHEEAVERFYSWGVERFGDWHGSYLNFGLWDSGAEDYVTAAETLIDRLATMIGLDASSTLLDVACGMGTQDRHLMQRFGCRSIEAIDLVGKHVEIARGRNPYPNLTYRVGDACRLDASDGSFSHVIAVEGIIHFDTRERFLHDAHRVLACGGRLGLADYFVPRTPRSPLERAVLAALGAAWHVPQANVCGLEAYRAALERAGFTDIELRVVSDHVIPGYVAEQRRPASRLAQVAIRGPVIGRLGAVIDALVLEGYRRGLLGYVLVSATRPRREVSGAEQVESGS